MWFKQTDQKTPQQPENTAPRPQPAPVVPSPSVDAAPAAVPSAPSAPVAAGSTSRLTPGLSLKGDISGREDLWIGGKVEGTLRFDNARVVVGASGKVHGKIEAREIVVEGKMDGDLAAVERLEITQTGNVRGGVSTHRLSLQEGAVFNGPVEVMRAGESRSITQGSSASARPAQAPRGSRFQNAQAAGAAAAGSGSAAAGSSPADSAEAKDGSATSTASVLNRGIAASTPERSE
jgi:cytoskeletal protein CcmA (bactofilin family)